MPNCFSAASVLILSMNAIFTAYFYLMFPSLPLTTLDEIIDLKNSFYNYFWRASPPPAALLIKWLKARSGEGRRHCTDMGQVLGCCWSREGRETAARTRTLVQLKALTGGVGQVSVATLWTWKLLGWRTFLRKWALPPVAAGVCAVP